MSFSRYITQRLGSGGLTYPWPLFALLADAGPLTQSDAAQRLGLTRGTCNLYCQALEAAGLVRRARIDRGRPGRPRVYWDADRDRNLLATVTFAVPRLLSTVYTLGGRVVFEQEDDLPDLNSLSEIERRVGRFLVEARRVEQQLSARLRLAVAALPGMLDGLTGRVVLAANVPALNGLEFEAQVWEQANVPALAAYLGLAFYYGETERLKPSEEVMVVYFDLGIGAVFGQGSQPFSPRPHDHPARPAAPGLGHVRVAPDGRPCHCGGRGCLEAYAAGWAMLERLASREARTLDDLLRLVREKDPLAVSVADEAMESLGASLAWPVHALGLDRIIVTGALAPLLPLVGDAFRRGFSRTLSDSEVSALWPTVSDDPFRAVRRGAFLLARDVFLHPSRFDPPRSLAGPPEHEKLSSRVMAAAWRGVEAKGAVS